MDSMTRYHNSKKKQGEGMERIIRLLWVIVILLVVLIAKDSIPKRVNADYRQSINISAIGGSSIIGKVLDVRIVE